MVRTYITARDDAVSYIKKTFTKGNAPLITVEAHPGRFDEAEIRRLAQRTPAILTSLMRIEDDSGEAVFISSLSQNLISFARDFAVFCGQKTRLFSGSYFKTEVLK